jgi:hypothetical protein
MPRTAALALALLFGAATAADGHEWQYFCFESAAQFGRISKETVFSVLPDPGSPKPAAAPAAPVEPVESEPAASAPAVDASLTLKQRVEEQLRVLNEHCYFMRVQYWTYEVCLSKSVRQYHSETGAAGGKAVHTEFSLGKWNAALDVVAPSSKEVLVQYFEEGDEGRRSKVKFVCPDSWRDEDGIVVVHEPKPKEYLITAHVQAMCPPRKGTPELKRKGKATDAAARRKLAATKAAAPPSAPAGPMQIAELVMPNTRLLASIRGRCFSTVRDYWTYEFCPMQHVRQYHAAGNRVSSEFSLGSYEKKLDKVTVGVRGVLDKKLAPHAFAQTYVNGTSNRRAQVRVRCASKNEHTLLAVDEPSQHEYVLLFSTPLACELSCVYAYTESAQQA